MSTASAPPNVPLRIGTDEQFEALRLGLERSGFTEDGICRRLGIPSIFHFKTIGEGRAAGVETRDALDSFIRLLMDQEMLSEDELRSLPPDAVAALDALDVIRPAPDGSARVYATVVLYPVNGI